jgi:hypothetical protein
LSRVVIATGRFNNPRIPPVPGLDSSRCDGETHGDDGMGIRVLHSLHYKDPGAFRGLRVLVAGGAISALEIACDLVDSGAASVTCSSRRQRYVVGKLHHGIPTDHFNYSFSQAFAGELLSDDELASELKAFVLENAGNPEKSGAPRPHDDIRRAGWTKCQHYLDYVAKNQIATVPWIKRIENARVYFEDDSSRDVDAIIFATGFELGLPFLDTEIKQKLSLGPDRIALCKHTFHPELPGLALLGFYNQVGPYFPILELQARWIAYQFSGRCTAMDRKTLEDETQKYCNDWSGERRIPMHQLALLFSREINAMPAVLDWPEISRPLLFGPLTPGVFRLSGPDAMKSAPEQVRNAGFACNMIMDNHFLAHEKERLQQLGLEKILNA